MGCNRMRDSVSPADPTTDSLKHLNHMKIQKIIGEHGTLPRLCNNGACPAAIIADDGNAYIQGYVLESKESSQLTAPAGEGFVRMPLDTLRKIAGQVAAA